MRFIKNVTKIDWHKDWELMQGEPIWATIYMDCGHKITAAFGPESLLRSPLTHIDCSNCWQIANGYPVIPDREERIA